ncbi:MAG TPA: GNAT family N-acetyltransferase [bacterium]|nr:GNAT family N-acetyltransferase [bacterium]
METQWADGYRISDDPARVDLELLTRWLSGTYWVPGIGQDEVRRSLRHSSLVVSAHSAGGAPVGFARVVSDKTRFGYFMDVYVEETHRRRGLAKAMIQFAMDHPDHRGVYLWLLATRDAQSVYAKAGFRPLAHPERWMEIQKGRPVSP